METVKYIALLLFALGQRQVLGACPPAGFGPINNQVDADEFISAPWYSVKQVVVSYQPLSQFYCVKATYTKKPIQPLPCSFLGCLTFEVFNFARRGSVSGTANSVTFQGTVYPDTTPAEVFVGPRFIPGYLIPSTNLWIVAAGTYDELSGVNYNSDPDAIEWAILTTGRPTSTGSNGKCFSSGGMWIFSRLPIPPSGAINAIDEIADSLGLDSNAWKPVQHSGCKYI